MGPTTVAGLGSKTHGAAAPHLGGLELSPHPREIVCMADERKPPEPGPLETTNRAVDSARLRPRNCVITKASWPGSRPWAQILSGPCVPIGYRSTVTTAVAHRTPCPMRYLPTWARASPTTC